MAYSSVSHLGFVMLGIFALNAQGISGAILQMRQPRSEHRRAVPDRRHALRTPPHPRAGGFWRGVESGAAVGALALIVTLSSAGLPGLNGFVGEFTILLGAFGSDAISALGVASPWYAGIATLGVILAAVYLLVMFEKVFLGAVTHEENTHLRDINLREVLILLPLLVLIFWIGLYPKPFLTLINPTVEQLVQRCPDRCTGMPVSIGRRIYDYTMICLSFSLR